MPTAAALFSLLAAQLEKGTDKDLDKHRKGNVWEMEQRTYLHTHTFSQPPRMRAPGFAGHLYERQIIPWLFFSQPKATSDSFPLSSL